MTRCSRGFWTAEAIRAEAVRVVANSLDTNDSPLFVTPPAALLLFDVGLDYDSGFVTT